MNEIERIRKSLANIKTGERGWQKVLDSSPGSFSRKLAEKNMRRLTELRRTLLNELNSIDLSQ